MALSPAGRRAIITSLSTLIIVVLSIVVIFWARGFKFDRNQGLIKRTGIIVITSQPQGAKVYLDDKLVGATNTTITFLDPKNYNVKAVKDGYWPWQKSVSVKEDLADEIEILLIPQAPELKPLTTTGALSPTLSPDGQKIAYVVPGTSATAGVWVLTLSDKPFGIGRDSRQIVAASRSTLFDPATLVWSPDSKTVLVSLTTASDFRQFLLDADNFNANPQPQTAITVNSTLQGWQETIRTNQAAILAKVPSSVRLEATGSGALKPKVGEATTTPPLTLYPFGVQFSPDEEKLLYQVATGPRKTYRVYDQKKEQVYNLPDFGDAAVTWFPDSAHLLIVEKNQISLVEIDGGNKTTIFGGSFENGFVFSYPNAARVVIDTTFNQISSSTPNLYSIILH